MFSGFSLCSRAMTLALHSRQLPVDNDQFQ
jgi:hypothetical protein